MKMYILVRESIPLGLAMTAAAHCATAAHQKFWGDPDYDWWLNNSFKKVVCKVTDEEFEHAKQFDKHIVMDENNYNDEETAIVFCPREKFPKDFWSYKLYGDTEPRSP